MNKRLKSPGSNPNNMLKIGLRDQMCCGDEAATDNCTQYWYWNASSTNGIPLETLVKVRVGGVDYSLPSPVAMENAEAVRDAIRWALTKAGYSSGDVYVSYSNFVTYITVGPSETTIILFGNTVGEISSIDVCVADDLVAVPVRYFRDFNGDEIYDAGELLSVVAARAWVDNPGTALIATVITNAQGLATFYAAKGTTFYVDFDNTTLQGNGKTHPTTQYKEIVVAADGTITYTPAAWPDAPYYGIQPRRSHR